MVIIRPLLSRLIIFFLSMVHWRSQTSLFRNQKFVYRICNLELKEVCKNRPGNVSTYYAIRMRPNRATTAAHDCLKLLGWYGCAHAKRINHTRAMVLCVSTLLIPISLSPFINSTIEKTLMRFQGQCEKISSKKNCWWRWSINNQHQPFAGLHSPQP